MKDNYGHPIRMEGTITELTAKQIALLLWEDMAEHGYRRKEQSKVQTKAEHREAAHDLVEQIKRAPDLLDTEVSK